jgi:hypothetical protein
MPGEIDLLMLEKQTGKTFANRMQRNLISSIKSKVKTQSGEAIKSKAKPSFKNGLLDKITVFTPFYIYPILHMGFEGSKKDGVNYRIEAKNFLNDALENGRLVEELADVIGNQRAEDIVAKINILPNRKSSGNE